MAEKRTFRECTMSWIDHEFGLKQARQSTVLDEWLGSHYELSPFEREALLRLQEKLNRNVYHWNVL
jgi:hypothetical protein